LILLFKKQILLQINLNNIINLQCINQAISLLVKRKNEVPNVAAFGFTKPKNFNQQGFSLTGINTIIDCVRKSCVWLKLYTRYNLNIFEL
jgi:hypothetical protein